MTQIDITLTIVCSTCGTMPLSNAGDSLFTLNEHTTVRIKVQPHEFGLCPACGNPVSLQVQAQPYELANHLDNPVMRNIYEQGINHQ